MSSTGKREYLREEMGVESEVREQRERERERGEEREDNVWRGTEALGMSQRKDKDAVEGSRASHACTQSVPSIVQ
jgi:hypothetical protein